MKKLLGLALACALLLTGCGARGGDKGEELGDNTIRPLELTEEEAALLKLVGGLNSDYGTYQFKIGEGITGCDVEVLTWTDGQWKLTGGSTVAVSGPSDQARMGVVLGDEEIRINWQDGASQISVTTSLGEPDRSNEAGCAWTWLNEGQALTPGERTPIYLEVYQKEGVEEVNIGGVSKGFTDAERLDSYDRAYAVAVTLEA